MRRNRIPTGASIKRRCANVGRGLPRRRDLEAAARALEKAGFIHRHVAGMDVFLDGPDAKARDVVRLIFAGEKVRPEHESAAPDVTETEKPESFRIVALEALVRMKLTSFRDKDQVHLRDMLEIGLIDQTWTARFSPALANRLQQLIDTPGE